MCDSYTHTQPITPIHQKRHENENENNNTTGPPPHIPSLRRRMDVHRQEPIVQDGIKRDGLRLEDQDRRMQERRCHRRGEEELVRWWLSASLRCDVLVVWGRLSVSRP